MFQSPKGEDKKSSIDDTKITFDSKLKMITEVDKKLPQIITSTPKSMEENLDDAVTNLPEITSKTNVPIIIDNPMSRGD